MAVNGQATVYGSLVRLDLPLVFQCAVELAEAAADLAQAEWAKVPVDISGPDSPHYAKWCERHQRLGRVDVESQRLKRSLGATGPLSFSAAHAQAGPQWEGYDQQFNNTAHERVVRLALFKIATAAIDLSGFATWRQWHWDMRETGLRLLTWGLHQLWEGLNTIERATVRDRLPRITVALGWPENPIMDPPTYVGPEQIPLPDQFRVFNNYITCESSFLNDMQEAHHLSIQDSQQQFLRSATLEGFVELAERAGRALDGMFGHGNDQPDACGDHYLDAFWALQCLRLSAQISPADHWSTSALQCRKTIAESAAVLLTRLAGTPQAKANLQQRDVDHAREQFSAMIASLRTGFNNSFIDRLLAGASEIELSAGEVTVLEAFLEQQNSSAQSHPDQPDALQLDQAAIDKLNRIRDKYRKPAEDTDATPTHPAGDEDDDPLSQRAVDFLIAMFELKAFRSDSRQSTAQIVKRAMGADADVNSCKTVMAELVMRGLVSACRGRGGGYWLTPAGKSRAERIVAN